MIKALYRLYGYVRAGRLEDAIDLCRKAHQPWPSEHPWLSTILVASNL
jgi:hypothetical protein